MIGGALGANDTAAASSLRAGSTISPLRADQPAPLDLFGLLNVPTKRF
jgi:hypothetical protein